MPHFKRLALPLFACFLFYMPAHSQNFIGPGFGTFNVPGASMPFRGLGPTLSFEHAKYNTSVYINVSYFQKSIADGSTEMYDNNGIPVGSASVTRKFSYIYNQIGFKALLGGDVDKKKINPFIGGGAAIVFAKQKETFEPSYGASDAGQNSILYGFHFLAGLQYYTKPVLLELKGTFDLVLKPLVDDNSNILTTLRFTALIPISH